MTELVDFGLTTEFVREQFQDLVEKHGSLAQTITSLLNRDKYLTAKYRFRSLANCEVWQEHLRPGIDSLANLSPVLRMLDTYVKFNRLESRAAAIEELLHAFAPEKRQYLEDRIFDKSSDADVGLGDSWQALQGESSERSFAGGNDAQLPRADGEGMRTIFLSRPALAIDSVNQTLLEPSLPFANAFCQTETSTKDASVQTDCSLPEKIQKQIKIQTDPIRFLAIKKILSSPPSSVAFKNVIDTDEPPAAKRPRKVRPSKAVIYNSCTPTTTSVVKTSCGSSTTFFNNVFSGSPLFNSIAPSQPGLTLKTSRASLQGNIYTYCRQAGMVVPMQQSHQQNSFLNPRVVLSPLPLLSPNDIGPQGDNMYRQRMQNFKRNQLEPRYSFPYIRNKVPQQQILPSPNLTEKNDQSKLSAADITTTAFTLSPFYISKVSDGLPFKTECTADSGFPIPNTSSAFLPNSSHDLLLKRHFDDQHTTPKTAKN